MNLHAECILHPQLIALWKWEGTQSILPGNPCQYVIVSQALQACAPANLLNVTHIKPEAL